MTNPRAIATRPPKGARRDFESRRDDRTPGAAIDPEGIGTRDRLRKSPHLMIACGVLWAALVARYDPLLWPLFDLARTPVERGLVAFALLWIHLAWFYGVFHVTSVVFSLLARAIPKPAPDEGDRPDVAILYTVCDDFDERAARTLVEQDYSACRVYLLDDSARHEERRRVEAFRDAHPDRCVLVRRPRRTGFKAGNLNHALATVARDCPYFVVVDADVSLPPDFVRRGLGYLRLDPRIGFVQANHRYRREPRGSFAGDLSGGVDLHWGLFLPARNSGGFVMFYGHGAILRREAWEDVGGFPEVVAEDIAFAARARARGWHGLFVRDLVAEEAFPGGYAQFVRREIRVLRGTWSFLVNEAAGLIRAPRVTLAEKFDCLASCGVLFLPIVFLGFLLAADVLLPWMMARERLSELGAGGSGGILGALEPLGAGLTGLWTWDFYLVTLATILAPLAYQIPALFRSPSAVGRYALQSASVFLSVIPALAMRAFAPARRDAREFRPTGDLAVARGESAIAPMVVSVAAGVLLAAAAWLTGNYALLTVAFSFALYPLFLRGSWDRSPVRVASLLPLLCFIAVFATVPFVALGVAGALVAAMPAHH